MAGFVYGEARGEHFKLARQSAFFERERFELRERRFETRARVREALRAHGDFVLQPLDVAPRGFEPLLQRLRLEEPVARFQQRLGPRGGDGGELLLESPFAYRAAREHHRMLRVDLLESEGHVAFEATLRQARRAPRQEGEEAQKKQPGQQKAEREIERLLNQDSPPNAARKAPLSRPIASTIAHRRAKANTSPAQ